MHPCKMNPLLSVNYSPAVQAPHCTIELLIPINSQIHSDQIMDQINGPACEIPFASLCGLSTFNEY